MRGQLSLEMLLLMSAMMGALAVILPLYNSLFSASNTVLEKQGALEMARSFKHLCSMLDVMGKESSANFLFNSPCDYEIRKKENSAEISFGEGSISFELEENCELPTMVGRGKHNFFVKKEGSKVIVYDRQAG
ncbi:hypothetical protein DRN74_01830 [Candidatus Micrarchaeota archaeon]|nr:MAG: hypothetical protein DRN74_01830 [Candidatus Micrarchaeota archaeon]